MKRATLPLLLVFGLLGMLLGTARAASVIHLECISTTPSRTHSGNRGSYGPQISRNGRYVVFESRATDLVAGMIDNTPNTIDQDQDVYCYDRQTGEMILISRDYAQANRSRGGEAPRITPDGRYITFLSKSNFLSPQGTDTNGEWDVFVWDRETRQNTLVSANPDGHAGNASSSGNHGVQARSFPRITPEGRWICFNSKASDLVPGVADENDNWDVFVRDLQTQQTYLVSANVTGGSGNGRSDGPVISENGQVVVFRSNATDLVSAPAAGSDRYNLYARYLPDGPTVLISSTPSGQAGGLKTLEFEKSGMGAWGVTSDGSTVVFDSEFSLASNDLNGRWDVYRRHLSAPTCQLVSGPGLNGQIAHGDAYYSALSRDGRSVAFVSTAPSLVPNDTNGTIQDVFVRDLQTGHLGVASVTPDGNTGNGLSGLARLSANGRFLVFTSEASNLVPGDTYGWADTFYRDLVTGQTHALNRSQAGAWGFQESTMASLSDDGHVVAFASSAPNLTPPLIDDSNGGFNNEPSSYDVFVSIINTAPIAGNESYVTGEDTPLIVGPTGGLLVNDGDIEDQGALAAVLATPPAHGTVHLNPDGGFTYTPAADYSGADSFTYRATDGYQESNPATVQLTVMPVNNAPEAADQVVVTAEDTPKTVTLTASDRDGDPLTYTVVTAPAHGVLSGTAPNLTYTPAENYAGPDSLTFRVGDGSVNSNLATVSITVTPVNDAPSATADSYTTAEDTPLMLAGPGVLGNDADPEGTPLAAVPGSGPAHGSLTLNPDGSFTYTPGSNFHGTDTFTYRASDGEDESPEATVTIQVTPVNDAPVAGNDAYTTDEDQPLTVPAPGVLGNDPDVDGDPLTSILIGGPAHGSVQLSPDGSLTYTPAPNYHGTDTFTYRTKDGQAESTPATVSLTIGPVNDAPVAQDQAVTTPEDTGKAITLSAGDVDADPLTYEVVTGPQHGTLAGAAPSLTYTPNAGYSGPDSFTFRAKDGAAESNTATVSITVQPVNHPPTANAGADQAVECAGPLTAVTLDGSASSDADGDPLTYRWYSGATLLATGLNPQVQLPLGTHSLRLEVSDGAASASDETVVTVRDTTAPTLSAVTASPHVLWPANHSLVEVKLDYSVNDAGDPSAACTVAVVSNEPDNGQGDGDMAGDIQVVDARTILLRAERSGKGSGRVYTITVTCTDAAGNRSSRVTTVTVPKSKAK